MGNKFRSTIGSRYTKSLFFELTGADKSTVLYTLKDEDHLGYPSLYKLYMATEDTTEWEFANQYFDGWEHWTMVAESAWFKPFIERWRVELELKLRAQALKAVKDEAASNSKNAYYANKFLLEGGWKPKGEEPAGRGRGRPKKSNETKDAILEKEASIRIKMDYDRMVGNKEIN